MDERPRDATSLEELARLDVSSARGAIRIPVRVRPRSSRSAVLGVRDGSLDVALHAPPADGAANAELCELMARALEIRKSNVSIVMGASHRNKLLSVSGVDAERARELLGRAMHGKARK